MDTLREFVKAVWLEDEQAPMADTTPRAWSKPDSISGDFELRRLTTNENRDGRRTDFFEFYWAHLMEGTTLSHIGAWAKVLLWRAPWRLPGQLLGFWVTLWVLVLTGLGAVVAKAAGWLPDSGGMLLWFAALWTLLGGAVIRVLLNVAGDAARYLHVAPENIAIRRKIREAGIDLLEKVHDDGGYERIILVGHSLGTVIGYDILTHLWPRYNRASELEAGKTPDHTALQGLEKLAGVPGRGKLDVDAFQAAQAAYFAELQGRKKKWLVSDFVTMGSPLAHAEVLMARDAGQLRMRKEEREFPTCPPTLETLEGQERFSYPMPNAVRRTEDVPLRDWLPHHAAVFAPTRWTNLYFPCHQTLWGDVIGGMVRPVFGPGVRDVEVHTDLQFGLLSHTLYWTLPQEGKADWIAELRKAARICESPVTSVVGPLGK